MSAPHLTEAAAARVAAIATRQGGVPAILRLSVEGGGCAGFQYRFGLETEIASDDLTTETVGADTGTGAKEVTSALVEAAISEVDTTRAGYGALQNQLEHASNNMSTTKENLQAAESRVRDVDMADEMMNYTKNNILLQASQAMLAQANQQPQGILQLLQ